MMGYTSARAAWAVACLIALVIFVDQGALAGVIYLVAVLAGGWLIPTIREHMSSRPCPQCGERVEKVELDCPYCDFDFRTIDSGPTNP
jgi:hypothetical protein